MNYKKKDKRDAETTTIKSAFASLLSSYDIEDKFKEKLLIASWSRVMGKPIANRTDKLYFRDKTLFIHLNSAPLKSELDHSKEKVIDILQREFGKDVLNKVVFL